LGLMMYITSYFSLAFAMVAPPSGHLAPAQVGSKDSRPLDRLNHYKRIAEIVKRILTISAIKSAYKPVYGVVELHKGLAVSLAHIAQAVFDVILEDYLGGVVER